jgi:hypothetical protein
MIDYTLIEVKYGTPGGETGFSLSNVSGLLSFETISPNKDKFQIPREIAINKDNNNIPLLSRFRCIELESIRYFVYGVYQYNGIDEIGRPTYVGKCLCVSDIQSDINIDKVYNILYNKDDKSSIYISNEKCKIKTFNSDFHYFIVADSVDDNSFFDHIELCSSNLCQVWHTSDIELIQDATKRSNVFSISIDKFVQFQKTDLNTKSKEPENVTKKVDIRFSQDLSDKKIDIQKPIAQKSVENSESINTNHRKYIFSFSRKIIYKIGSYLFRSKTYFVLSNLLLTIVACLYILSSNDTVSKFVNDSTKQTIEVLSLEKYLNKNRRVKQSILIEAVEEGKLFKVAVINKKLIPRPSSIYSEGDVFTVLSDDIIYKDNNEYYVKVDDRFGDVKYVEASKFIVKK